MRFFASLENDDELRLLRLRLAKTEKVEIAARHASLAKTGCSPRNDGLRLLRPFGARNDGGGARFTMTGNKSLLKLRKMMYNNGNK